MNSDLPRGRARGQAGLLDPDELPRRGVDETPDRRASRRRGVDRVDERDDARLPQDQRLGLLLVERQALRDGLGGIERVGGVGDGADGPPEGTSGRVFVGREPRAARGSSSSLRSGRGASEVDGLKMLFCEE